MPMLTGSYQTVGNAWNTKLIWLLERFALTVGISLGEGGGAITPVTSDLTIANATTEAVVLPAGVNHLLRLSDAATSWKWSEDEAVVDAGGGFPIYAGESLAFDQWLNDGATIYVRHASGSPQTMNLAYMQRGL